MTKKTWLLSASLAISTLYADPTPDISVLEMLNTPQDLGQMVQVPSVDVEEVKTQPKEAVKLNTLRQKAGFEAVDNSGFVGVRPAGSAGVSFAGTTSFTNLMTGVWGNLVFRPMFRIGLDTIEGVSIVYANAPMLASAATWTATSAFSAVSYSAKTTYATAAWGYKAYSDGTHTKQEKTIKAIQNTAYTVSEVVKAVAGTLNTVVQNAAPVVVKTLVWLGSETWTRAKEFASDARVLLGH